MKFIAFTRVNSKFKVYYFRLLFVYLLIKLKMKQMR